MKKITIAIDGYSACGKSTTAKKVSSILGYTYIDSGAMYRAVTLYFLNNYITLTNDKEVQQALEKINVSFKKNPDTGRNETYLNGLNVEEEIRKMKVTEKVSPVSAIPAVRRAMVELQQKLGKKKGIIMDGRDIGTVVFPGAELKIFMTADVEVRAARRQQELLEKKQLVEFDRIRQNLKERDAIDSTRKEGPLKQAEDAVMMDTSHLSIEEQVDLVVEMAMGKIVG